MEITWTNGEWWRLEPETGIKNSLQRQTSSPSNKSTTRTKITYDQIRLTQRNLRFYAHDPSQRSTPESIKQRNRLFNQLVQAIFR